MTTALRRLRIDRVDFVDKGANPGALITLAKRATVKEPKMAELPEDVAKRLNDQAEAVAALTKRAEEAEKKAETTEALAKQMAEDLKTEVAKREQSEAVAIAKSVVLPGVEDKVAFVAKLRKALGADWPVLEGVLKALATADKTSEVFKELGSDATQVATDDGYQELTLIADGLVAKGLFTNRAAALPAAMQTPEGKAAYAKYQATITTRRA